MTLHFVVDWAAGPDWWDLVPAVVGGVLGALAGGIPAYWLSVRSSREVLLRDKTQRDEVRRAQAFRLFANLSLIANSILTLRQMVDRMLERSVDPEDKAPNQRRVSAIVGSSSEQGLRFSPDDLSLLVAAKNIDLVTDLPLLASRHTAICVALDEYKKMKQVHADLLSAAGKHNFLPGGMVGTTITDASVAAKIMIQDQQLESVIVEIISMLRENTTFIFSIVRQFNESMKEFFPTGRVPNLDLKDAERQFSSPLNEQDQ